MDCDDLGRRECTGRARLAVLIDGENASARHVRAVFEFAGKIGEARVRRSYGDFTRLAQRLREGGLAVYGFGESKAPQAFRAACHRFETVGKARSRAREPGPQFFLEPDR